MRDTGITLRGRKLHAAWAAFLGRVRWQCFVTLTFEPNRRFPVGRDLADRETRIWCYELGRISRRPVGWAYAVERRPSGMWHAHVLVVGMPPRFWLLAVQLWEAPNGRIDVQKISRTPERVCLYTTKQGAIENQIVVADTMPRYARKLVSEPRVALYEERGSGLAPRALHESLQTESRRQDVPERGVAQ